MENSISIYQKDLFSYALSLSKNSVDAEDLVQDTFVRFLSRHNKSETPNSTKSYLMSILRNIYFDSLRRRKLKNRFDDYKKNALLEGYESAPNNTENLINEEYLYYCIGKIKADWREPFLNYYRGYSYEEMAQQTGLNIETLRMRVFYARRELMQSIKKAER